MGPVRLPFCYSSTTVVISPANPTYGTAERACPLHKGRHSLSTNQPNSSHLLTSQHTAHPPLPFLPSPIQQALSPSHDPSKTQRTNATCNHSLAAQQEHSPAPYIAPSISSAIHTHALTSPPPPSLHPPSFPQNNVTVHDWPGSKARFHAVVLPQDPHCKHSKVSRESSSTKNTNLLTALATDGVTGATGRSYTDEYMCHCCFVAYRHTYIYELRNYLRTHLVAITPK